MSDRFRPRHDADVLTLIAAYPLATVVTGDLRATPLPLLAECDGDGRLVALIGHYARSNPQLASIAADRRALILFNGPAGYISPELVPNRDWAPTWNYAVARITADIVLTPEADAAAIERLVTAMEAGRERPWSTAEMGERYTRLVSRIASFRAEVRSVNATFKLGQDEAPATFDAIVDGLGDRALAEWMRGQRDAAS